MNSTGFKSDRLLGAVYELVAFAAILIGVILIGMAADLIINSNDPKTALKWFLFGVGMGAYAYSLANAGLYKKDYREFAVRIALGVLGIIGYNIKPE